MNRRTFFASLVAIAAGRPYLHRLNDTYWFFGPRSARPRTGGFFRIARIDYGSRTITYERPPR